MLQKCSLQLHAPQEYVRAVLVAARPGLAAAPLAAQDASGLLARRLAAYKASLALLAVDQQERGGSGSGDDMDGRGRGLEEKAAATLVSVLEAELGGITSAPDLTEVRAASSFVRRGRGNVCSSVTNQQFHQSNWHHWYLSSVCKLMGFGCLPASLPARLWPAQNPCCALFAAICPTRLCCPCPCRRANQVTEKAMEAFEGGSPLGCVALELLPKALTLLQVRTGALGLPALRSVPAWRSLHAGPWHPGLHRQVVGRACSLQAGQRSALVSKPLSTVQMAGGGEADQVGSSACTGIINRVCQYSWPLGSIGKVLAVLRDFPL